MGSTRRLAGTPVRWSNAERSALALIKAFVTIPLMKKLIIFIVAVAIVVSAYFVFTVKKTTTDGLTKYSSTELGVEFSYPSGPKGYVLEEKTPTNDSNKEFVRSLILWRSEDKAKIAQKKIPVGGEGPATINVLVFKNSKKQLPTAWAIENALYSSINLRTADPVEDVVGGANAIHYIADGLYPSDNFIVAYGENMYVFTGQYQNPESPLKKDFLPMVVSVRFIPQVGQK